MSDLLRAQVQLSILRGVEDVTGTVTSTPEVQENFDVQLTVGESVGPIIQTVAPQVTNAAGFSTVHVPLVLPEPLL